MSVRKATRILEREHDPSAAALAGDSESGGPDDAVDRDVSFLAPERRHPKRSRRWPLITAGLLILGGLLGVGLFMSFRVAQSARVGKRALLQADADVRAQRVDPARQDLAVAGQAFGRMQQELNSYGPVVSVARVIPLLSDQVRAVQTFARAGANISQTGLQIVNAASLAQKSSGGGSLSSTSLERFRALQVSVHQGVKVISSTTADLDRLRSYKLIGPLGQARSELSRRLATVATTARSADDGLTALIAFIGGAGPRRYLVLSQNPDEIRPTGGYIGSYGVLTADSGKLTLEHYANSEEWELAHPGDVVPAAKLGSPFRFYDPPLPENLTNVNTVPDWPQVAQLAIAVWQGGGEQADGVVSFTPGFMARVLAVVGPVQVPSYGETITAQNVDERLNFYTHVQPPPPGSDRKAFLAPLGQAVMAKLVTVSASQWGAMATALSKAFDARQLMVWSRDPAVESILARRGWDGVLPSAKGDFLASGEFEYASKNGRDIKRSIDDHVVIRADGSARITMTITYTNTGAPSPVNSSNSLLYVTLYGPAGAKVDESASDPTASAEPSIAGHPATGWFIAVPPSETSTLNVTWDAPAVATHNADGTWTYQLRWVHVVDNTGDVLNLRVDLPAGGSWRGAAPPAKSPLVQDLTGTWTYRT